MLKPQIRKITTRHLCPVLLMLSLGACSTVGYYTQSVTGQMKILFNRQDVNALITNPETPSTLKQKLQQATEIRQFASDKLALPKNKSYLYYTDLERPYVVWNVFAAPEFSFAAKTWCYLIIGCVSYRGYFDEQDAIKTAEKLKEEQYDVHVAGIAAYSTLGWFDDPLLNSMMHWQTRNLAGLIFHELSHQIIYIKNETAINEAFSTAVERLGTMQWLLTFHPDELNIYLQSLTAQQDFRQLLLDTRGQLMMLYESDINVTTMRAKKAEIIENLRQRYEQKKLQWPDNIQFDGWFQQPINNARLTSTMTYLQQIPAFYQLFIENNGIWQDFYQSVIRLDKMSKAKRDAFIANKLIQTPDIERLITLIKFNLDPASDRTCRI